MSNVRRLVMVAIVVALLSACQQSTVSTTVGASGGPSITVPSRTNPPSAKPKPSKHITVTSKPKSHPHPKPSHRPHPPGVPRVDVPNLRLTPGVAFPVGLNRICVSGYSASVRDVSDSEKQQVYDRYGIPWVSYQHEVDHLVSLEIGGSNSIRNLWPEPYAGRWGARTKDVLENRLHELVCDHQLALRTAQRQEARNWVAAYRRYVGVAPTGGGKVSVGHSAGGFYASSYASASTIYCADDPEWRYLSKTYLQHFATYAKAKARFPSYHLHQAC